MSQQVECAAAAVTKLSQAVKVTKDGKGEDQVAVMEEVAEKMRDEESRTEWMQEQQRLQEWWDKYAPDKTCLSNPPPGMILPVSRIEEIEAIMQNSVMKSYYTRQLDFTGLPLSAAARVAVRKMVGSRTHLSGSFYFDTKNAQGGNRKTYHRYPTSFQAHLITILKDWFPKEKDDVRKMLRRYAYKEHH